MALGFFDGVHMGHRAVISTMVELANQRGLKPCVFTFSPSGAMPSSKSGMTLLQTQRQKERIMSELGVKELISPDFAAIKDIDPHTFVKEVLVSKLGARLLVCGSNYRFGHKACADAKTLQELAEPMETLVVIEPPVLFEGEPVSSTRIRAALRNGDSERAGQMLGADFEIEGVISHGKGLGRRIGVPTINQQLAPGYTVPLYGVYLSRVTTPTGIFYGVTNIGVRPTVEQTDKVNCETYLFDFEGNLYGQDVSVALLRLLRPERRMESIEQLREQIGRDIDIAKKAARELQA